MSRRVDNRPGRTVRRVIVWAVGVAVAMWSTTAVAVGQRAAPSREQAAAARAAAARAAEISRATMPDTPGTGRFPAIKEEVGSLPDHVVYRPADLKKLGATRLGLYLFGNGGCSNDGASSRMHLEKKGVD